MGFANSVVGGMGKLIRAFIQSPDYKAGTSGWTVNKDGSVEFNSGSFRGGIVAGNVTIANDGTITITSSSNGSKIVINPNDVQPTIYFYSVDGGNFSFINAVIAGQNSRSDLGLNGGTYVPSDGVTRYFRCWMNGAGDGAYFECVDTNQNRKGGAVQISSTGAWLDFQDNGVDHYFGVTKDGLIFDGNYGARGIVGAFYNQNGTLASSTGSEAAMTGWSGGNSNITMKAGYLYRCTVRFGYYDSVAEDYSFNIKLRKGVNTTTGLQLGFFRPAGSNIPGSFVQSSMGICYVKNLTANDITFVPGLTITRATGTGTVSLYGDSGGIQCDCIIEELGIANGVNLQPLSGEAVALS